MTASPQNRSRLSYTRCPGVPTISALAHHLGTVRKELDGEPDLDVTYKSVGFNPQIDYPHEDRLWLRNAGHAPAVWKRSLGADCHLVALAWLEGSYPLVSLAASGITRVADLRGKRLPVIRIKDAPFDLLEAQQLKIYRTALASAGLTLADVTLVEVSREPHQVVPAGGDRRSQALIGLGNQYAALERGDFDAVIAKVAADATRYPELNVLYDTRLAPDPLDRVHPSVLRGIVVSGPLLRERRDLVVRILARLLQAGDWAKAHPLETLRLVAEDLQTPPEILAAVYENVAQGIQIDLSPTRLQALQVQKDFLLERKLIPADFDLAAWIDRTPLEDAHRLYAQWQAEGRLETPQRDAAQ